MKHMLFPNTADGLKRLNHWLGSGKWDVINLRSKFRPLFVVLNDHPEL